jgi:predicted adenine nucleotide alpha hydrolase (AANH) superfamily ATPase
LIKDNLVTNATHTGEVTGSGALTVDKIVIENKPFVTAEVGDFVLISDASDGGNLKKVDVIDFIDVFGQNFQSASSEDESSTTATTYQQKLRLNTPDLPDGTYRIGWFYEYRSNTVTRQFYGRVQINDTLTTSLIISEPKDAINYISESGMYYYVGSGITTIDLDYRISDNADLAFIRRARLEIWRVA